MKALAFSAYEARVARNQTQQLKIPFLSTSLEKNGLTPWWKNCSHSGFWEVRVDWFSGKFGPHPFFDYIDPKNLLLKDVFWEHYHQSMFCTLKIVELDHDRRKWEGYSEINRVCLSSWFIQMFNFWQLLCIRFPVWKAKHNFGELCSISQEK